jgi:hypothetical protein
MMSAPGALAQVGALIRMRSGSGPRAARWRTAAGLALVPLLAVAATLTGSLLPPQGQRNAQLLMPSAWLGFLITITLATGSSGARTLIPRAQTVAFPVTPAAEHLGALVLSPLNVAWLTQTLALLALSGWAFADSPAHLPGVVLTVAWIVVSTVVAQAIGWLVELARTARAGGWATRAVVALGGLAAVTLLVTGHLGTVLDHAPTVPLVAAASSANTGDGGRWLVALGGLTLIGMAAYLAGIGLTGRLQRRAPRDQVAVEARDYPGRADPRHELTAALRIDHAGLWRSAPLRRGLVVLTAVPALACAGAGLDWSLAAVLPGLVASGAGLLFGVNALSLDGSGALWRESLPGSPRVVLVARLLMVAEICLAPALLAAVLGAVRAPQAPTSAAVVAVLCAVVTTTSQVVGWCATWSVGKPYAATLRDARDQPAPPAAMAGYSVRLALSTTGSGLLFSACSRYRLTDLALAAAVAITSLALRRTLRAVRRWEDDAVRCRVVAMVAG